jgi:hypothetical protein
VAAEVAAGDEALICAADGTTADGAAAAPVAASALDGPPARVGGSTACGSKA